MCIHYIWIAPFHLIVSTYLIYLEIGPIAFVFVILIFMAVSLQFFLAKSYAKLRYFCLPLSLVIRDKSVL